MFEPYQLAYAERHHIPAHWILENEKLELAAFLEHMIKTHTLTVSDARRRFVNNYPESNRLPVPKYIYDRVENTYKIDHNYERGSVLSLIQAFDDSIWI